MKFLRTLIITVLVLIGLTLVSLFIYFNMQGKQLIVRKASQLLDRPVSVGEMRFMLPMTFYVSDLRIAGLLEAEDAEFAFDLSSFLHQDLRIARVELTNPILYVFRSQEGNIHIGSRNRADEVGVVAEETAAMNIPQGRPGEKVPVDIFPVQAGNEPLIDLFLVNMGQIHFIDLLGSERKERIVNEVQLKARNIPLKDFSVSTRFRFSAALTESDLPFLGEQISGEGSLDWHAKDMDATLDVLDPSGNVAFSSRLRSKDNDMLVDGNVKLKGLKSRAKADDDASLENMVLGALKASGMEVGADFSFRTRMDRFQVSNVKFSGNFTSGGSLTTQGSGNIMSDLKGIGKQFEAIGKKMVSPEAPEATPQTQQP